MRKKIAGLTALALTASLIAGCGASETETPISVQSVAMLTGLSTMGVNDRFAGVVEAGESINVTRDSSLTLGEVLVEAGDNVKKGDALFTYDTDALKLELDKMKLELEQLKNSITTRQEQIKELESEKKEASSSDQLSYTLQIQSLEVEIKETQYNITSKEKSVSQAEKTLKDSTVKSPADGTVKSVNNGSNGDTGDSSAFIVITQAGEFRIKGTVNEQNRSAIHEGMTVLVHSRMDDTTWKGTISLVDTDNPIQSNNDYSISSSDSGNNTASSNYPFYIKLDDADGLMIGQHVYIEADLGEEEEGEGIPLPAYFISDADSSPYLWVANEKDKLEKRDITLGSYDAAADTYQVLTGLTLDDYIADPNEPCEAGASVNRYDNSSFGQGGENSNPDVPDSGLPENGIAEGGVDIGGMDNDSDAGLVGGEISEDTASTDGTVAERPTVGDEIDAPLDSIT